MVTSAILLVGGMGTRMQPLTYATPKPMLPLLGRPFSVINPGTINVPGRLINHFQILYSCGFRNA